MDPTGNLEPQTPSPALRLDFIEGEARIAQFSKLLDRGFAVPEPGRFFDDFPIWDEGLGPGSERLARIGVWNGEELVSGAGVRLARYRAPAGDLTMALIGAVATAESHRGMGLASSTVSMAVRWARERGAALALLWGAETALYERLCFELCGMQVRVALSRLQLGEAPDFSSVVLGRGWIPPLLRCLRMRGSGLRVEESDERWLEAHRNVDWYWLGEPAAPLAYAAIGRGIDLHGVVHEWGGDDPASLKTLLGLVRMEHPEAQLLANPELLGAWGLGSPPAEIEFLCLARALDVGRIAAMYGVPLAPNDPLLNAPDAPVCRALFGPGEGVLPLWIWGLDAV